MLHELDDRVWWPANTHRTRERLAGPTVPEVGRTASHTT